MRQNDAWFRPNDSCPKMFWHASPGPIDAFSAARAKEQMYPAGAVAASRGSTACRKAVTFPPPEFPMQPRALASMSGRVSR